MAIPGAAIHGANLQNSYSFQRTHSKCHCSISHRVCRDCEPGPAQSLTCNEKETTPWNIKLDIEQNDVRNQNKKTSTSLAKTKLFFIYFDSFLFSLLVFSMNISLIKYNLVMSLSSLNFSKICFSSLLIQLYILLYQKIKRKRKRMWHEIQHTHKPTKTQNQN